MGWGFTSAKRQAFRILEKVKEANGVATVPETHQQKAELRVLDNSQCGFWSGALTGGLRSSQMCAGDTTAQVKTFIFFLPLRISTYMCLGLPGGLRWADADQG